MRLKKKELSSTEKTLMNEATVKRDHGESPEMKEMRWRETVMDIQMS